MTLWYPFLQDIISNIVFGHGHLKETLLLLFRHCTGLSAIASVKQYSAAGCFLWSQSVNVLPIMALKVFGMGFFAVLHWFADFSRRERKK